MSLDLLAVSTDLGGMRSGVELGKRCLIRPLGRIQSGQAGGNALGIGGNDRRHRDQRNKGYRSGKDDRSTGVLEKFRHEDFSFSVDAPHNTRMDKYNDTGIATIKVTGHIKLKPQKPLILLRRTHSI